MCIPNFYKPLIFSRQSHSQDSATQRWSKILKLPKVYFSFHSSSLFQISDLKSSNYHKNLFHFIGALWICFRYLDTAALVYSWYSSDCWEQESLSSSMIRRVNALHRFSSRLQRAWFHSIPHSRSFNQGSQLFQVHSRQGTPTRYWRSRSKSQGGVPGVEGWGTAI